MNESKDLVEIIKANPGCIATIDNDCWWLDTKEGTSIATSRDNLVFNGEKFYGGNIYGGDILQSLAIIVGIEIKGV